MPSAEKYSKDSFSYANTTHRPRQLFLEHDQVQNQQVYTG